jgi:hypothetical protein
LQLLQWPKYNCVDRLGVLCYLYWGHTSLGVYGEEIPRARKLVFWTYWSDRLWSHFSRMVRYPSLGE